MYDINKSIGFLLSKAYQRSWSIMREEIETYDLTPPQFGLLAFLWLQDGVTQVELSEKARLTGVPSADWSIAWKRSGWWNVASTPRTGGHTRSTSHSAEGSWKARFPSAPIAV